MAGIPAVVGDTVVNITKAGEPQVHTSVILSSDVAGVLFRGKIPAALPGLKLVAPNGGPWTVTAASLVSVHTYVRNKPVVLVGAVLSIGDGWSGTVIGPGAPGLLIG